MPKLRLLKVVVQAVFVIDDGEHLVERVTNPVVVGAEEWPHYASTRFLADAKALEQEIGSVDDITDS